MARALEQFELRLEELEAEEAADPPASTKLDDASEPAKRRTSGRRPLPAHLPRREVVHESSCVCLACGGAMRKVGEDVTEILDYVPGRFQVIRHVRPAFSCRQCESMAQAPMPALPVERGRPGPGLLAHVLVGRYCDHLPLYRQSGIYAREGVELDRVALADWVGKAAWLLAPLVETVAGHVMAAEKLHADDTPVPVLAPGTGKTKTGRLWVYLRDERPHGGQVPPAVVCRYSPDRKGEHPRIHLAGFRGFLQADGYAGFGPLYESKAGQPALATEVACRVGGVVTGPAPHRPGRADSPHPVLRAPGSLRRQCTGGRSRLAATGTVRAWLGSRAMADCSGDRVGRALSSISARAGGGTTGSAGRFR
jgi:transposase